MALKIVIDSREQKPFPFQGYECETSQGTLPTGDYSLAGLESLIAVERKSLDDLVASISHSRERFEKELDRLRGYEACALVCESPLSDLISGKYKSKMEPKAAYESLVAFMARYRLPIYFAQDRRGAERFTYSFLRHYNNTIQRRYKSAITEN